MADTTPSLALPLLAAGQAQKHVTHNEALMLLDTLVQCAVLDKDLSAPPSAPAEGDRYLIVSASPSGAWAGWTGRVARYQDGAWQGFVPKPGWLAFVVDEGDLYTYAAGAWTSFRATLTALQNLTRLGLGTAADATNPFAAKLNTALWTALATGEGGSGDLRYTLNKQAAGNVLSLLMQTGFSGRAEIGLTGDDDLRVKVSADGAAWTEALRIDRTSGNVDPTAAGASVAAAATVDLGALAATRITLTGTGTVTGFGTAPNRLRLLRFAGAATLTHSATSLVLPGAANLVTAAGDTALATSDAAGNWTVRAYSRASGKPVTGPAAADVTDATATGRSVLTAASAAAGASALGLGLGTASSPTFATLVVGGNGTFVPGALYSDANWGFLMRPRVAGAQGAYGWCDTGGGSLMVLRNTGELGVGTTGPTTRLAVAGIIAHSADNQFSLGTASLRATIVYAATGTINTSDARDKTPAEPLSEAEIAWAQDLAREVGSFRFLASVADKGDRARLHIGMTVQRAIGLGEARGLDPFRYAFICHDSWDAVDEIPAVAAVEEERDPETGEILTPATPGHPGAPARPAGDRYGFRPDQLALFIAAGQEARLAALEARLG